LVVIHLVGKYLYFPFFCHLKKIMKIKPLGTQGLLASELGFGCMGMSEFYGPVNDADSIRTLHRAMELGINFFDTADIYGPFLNEELLGKAIKGKRNQLTIATKFGIVRDPSNPKLRGFNGKPAYVKTSVENSLRRLDLEYIDLYYLHRVDPATPIEDTVGAMAELVREGKVRGLGLSEASAQTLRKAHGVHPITALQTEYSLWTRDPEDGILETCRQLGIAFVAYSPLGRGFLSGQIKKPEDLAPDDFRRFSPRFQGENFQKNLDLIKKIALLAASKGCSSSQLALAWVLQQGDNVFPIPGTKRISYLEENLGSLQVKLSEQELREIDQIAPKNIAAGLRYTAELMGSLNR
jgi:aryl-alcohol dehydrogenase-like predicted oxidoreductase